MPRYVFQIIDKCFQDASHIDVDSDVDFLLEESDWNDYGYMTLYGVHATAKRSRNEKTTYLGSIRIMRIDQQVNESHLLRKDFGKYHFKFRSLPDTYVSLSMDVDFYENLQQILRRPGERFDFANSLNMILGTDSEDYAKVYSLLCFQKSLLRDSNIDDFAIQQGRKIMLNEEILFDLRTEAFKIKFPSTDEYIEFDFQAVSDVLDSDTIPNGIVALIGKNGSGKSTTLYEIAKILYASPDTRRLIEDKVGRLETNAIGISKLIMFSYSAFDNFILPGSTKYECTMLIDGLQNHTGRFVFCGIRDVYYDMNELYETNRNKEDDEFIKITSCARTTGIRLKEPAKLGEEFVYAMSNFGESDRLLWIEFIKSVRNSQPELWQAIKNISEPLVSPFMNLESIYLSHFNRLSTGYKFVMHAMSHLISNCENNNLILFDEPENHLQPPLLSFVIKEMRKVLAKYKSVMLIATHSPIILQEIFAKNVKIVRGVGEKRIFSQPKIETYGESFGAIASEVFNLNSDNTGYYSTIEMLYDMWNMDKSKSLKEMISSFEHKMDSHLSAQMEAFLISKYVKKSCALSMWCLDKPSLQAAKDDLNNIVAHCRDIGNEDRPAFENLYAEYDHNKGFISEDCHHNFLIVHPLQAKAMYGQYKKLGENQDFNYIREELSAAAGTCPYCGFGEPVTLDHYMPESDYNELATCRLNLVPICWKCNHKKHDKDYNGFTHAYYQDFPNGVIFFKCHVDANAEGVISFEFYVDGENLDRALVEKLENQIRVIELNKRLNKECITFITSYFYLESLENNEALKFFISDRLKKAKDCFGNNDWHTALLQGLLDCDKFDVTCLKHFLGKNKKKNLV